MGEKARVLEQRGRKDVIAALLKHEIGFHSNTHSQQPTIAVASPDMRAGKTAEMNLSGAKVRGVQDIRRIFGVRVTRRWSATRQCVGSAGPSGALKNWASRCIGMEGIMSDSMMNSFTSAGCSMFSR